MVVENSKISSFSQDILHMIVWKSFKWPYFGHLKSTCLYLFEFSLYSQFSFLEDNQARKFWEIRLFSQNSKLRKITREPCKTESANFEKITILRPCRVTFHQENTKVSAILMKILCLFWRVILVKYPYFHFLTARRAIASLSVPIEVFNSRLKISSLKSKLNKRAEQTSCYMTVF